MADKILVISSPHDEHYQRLKAHLLREDIEAILWSPETLGVSSFVSVNFESNHARHLKLNIGGKTYFSEDFKLVWIRKVTFPEFKSLEDTQDQVNARRVSVKHITGTLSILENCVPVINGYDSICKSERKSFQYWLASHVGLPALETTISNDFESISRNFDKNKFQHIFKPLYLVSWIHEGRENVLPTTFVKKDNITPNNVASFPGIFQRFVEKRSEVRFVILGDKCKAVKIASRTTQVDFDWRLWKPQDLILHPIEFPKHLEKKCKELLKLLNLKMGVFDFIVDKKGEYWFLEVNSCGNFVVMEDYCPELKLSEFLCESIISMIKT